MTCPSNASILHQICGEGFAGGTNMHKALVVVVSLLAFAFVRSAKGAPGDVPALGAMVAWYRQPATKWMEGMPLGNGLMGAMAFGGVEHERIALNESSFWSGRPHDYDNPEAGQYFPKIRDLVLAGKFQEAEKMADEHFFG